MRYSPTDHVGERYGDELQLEVVGWDGVSRNKPQRNGSPGQKIYDVICHHCRERDSELYNGGKYRCVLTQLKSGRIACGCSSKYRPTYESYMILIKRSCDARGYKMESFVEHKQLGDSRVVLSCEKHEGVWDSQVRNLLAGQGTCPKCYYSKSVSYTHLTLPTSDLV